MNTKSLFLILIFQLALLNLFAQTDTLKCTKGRLDLGLEIQAYPAGIIPTITTNIYFRNRLALRLRGGGNFANRKDFSPYNDNETAKGMGGSIGLVTYYPYGLGHFTVGATIDIWNMLTNWKDNLDTPNPISGQTKTIVLQPWMDIGYLFNIKNTRINAGVTAGFGREINIITKGERVGEGWMNSITLTSNYTLKR